MQSAARMVTQQAAKPLISVQRSSVHGTGVFAARAIRKGTRIIEYTGERITHAQADSRYEDKDEKDNHTFLFIVDRKTVIDAGVDGNDARFINHSCDPNCEVVITRGRVYIHALRDIEEGAELFYDYWYITDESYTLEDLRRIYPCRCGSPRCRGTLARPPKKTRKRAGAR